MTILLAAFMFVSVSMTFAQQAQPGAHSPEDTLAIQQLIAWSRLQKPQPAPEPMPPRDAPVPQPDQQGQGSQPPHAQPPQERTPAAESFTGKIVREGSKFVLKTAGAVYELQEQGEQEQSELEQYENQNVKIIGFIDHGSKTIRVIKIQLLS